MRFPSFLFLASATASIAAGQTGIAIASSDYKTQFLLRAAPGQVTPLRLTGIPPLPASVIRPTSKPAPDTLAGISILAGRPNRGEFPMRPIPVLAVEQIYECERETKPDCLFTIVTVQFPSEFVFDDEAPSGPIDQPPAAFAVRYRDVVGPPFRVAVARDNVHIWQECDAVGERSRPCQAVVTDGAGSRIRSWSNTEPRGRLIRRDGRDAIPGDPIVLYGFGLGMTRPIVPAGTVSPSEAVRVLLPAYLEFEYLTDSGWIFGGGATEPQFAGLAPGSIGLYQINGVVPEPPATLRRCFGGLFFNTIVRLRGQTSSDEALICVEPGGAK